MVSDYSDAGQERWLADSGIDLLRGTGRLAGPGVVDVDGVRHTADQVVLANGADPIVPPVPGLRGLEGIWTNRDVTGMTSVPRRCWSSAGEPVGVEMAQAVRRFGGEVALVEGAPNAAARGSRRRSATHSPRCCVVTASNSPSESRRRAPAGRARNTSSAWKVAVSCAASGCWSRPAGVRATHDLGLDTVGISPDEHRIPVDAACGPANGCGRSATSTACGS